MGSNPILCLAPFGNGTTAISLILQAGAPAESIRGFYAGSMNFAGNQLAFHTVSGEKFTVTYTIDAVAKDKSQ